jgi:hypothetical protein
MAVEIYWNDLEPEAYLQLEAWKDLHEDDEFVLNRKSRDVAVLHRAWCRHLMHSVPRELTNKPKICSTKRQELEAWWARKSTVLLFLREARLINKRQYAREGRVIYPRVVGLRKSRPQRRSPAGRPTG